MIGCEHFAACPYQDGKFHALIISNWKNNYHLKIFFFLFGLEVDLLIIAYMRFSITKKYPYTKT